jgi:hypothetical protein
MAYGFDESTAKALQWLIQLQKDHGDDGIQRLMSGIGTFKSSNSSSIATSQKSFTDRKQNPLTPVESFQGNSEIKVYLIPNAFLISRTLQKVVLGRISMRLVIWKTFLTGLVKTKRGRKKR